MVVQKESQTVLEEDGSQVSGQTVLGRRLENPFSTKNMTKALDFLKTKSGDTRTSLDDIEIEATHYSVRFEPENEIQLGVLKRVSI